MKKVLVLGASSIQYDAIKYLKDAGYETYVCARDVSGSGIDLADHFAQINFLDVPAVAKYIKENNIDIVYSIGSDLAMPVACQLSEELNMPHFVPAESAYICNHKNLMRTTLTNECKGNIPFQVMEKHEPITIDFPCILKPSDTQGQRGIFLVKNQEEVDEHLDEAIALSRDKKAIVEHYIDGPEFSVNTYMVGGKLRYMVISDRITWPQYTGLIHKHVIPSRILTDHVVKEIEEIMEDSANRLKLFDGPVYYQIKVENNHAYLVEVTPRLDGCRMWNVLERATGVNLLKLSFEHLINNDISELDKWTGKIDGYELVFFCQEPNTEFDGSIYKAPDDSEFSAFFFKQGEKVSVVNGRYEKVGYYIRKD